MSAFPFAPIDTSANRLRAVTAAFASSRAIIVTDCSGAQTLVTLDHWPTGMYRMSFYLPDGPHGEPSYGNLEECIARVALLPGTVCAATEEQIAVWARPRPAGVDESAKTHPRVDRVLPEPGRYWYARHSATVARIISRSETGVRHEVTFDNGTSAMWIMSLADFLARHDPYRVAYLTVLDAPADAAGNHTAGWYYCDDEREWQGPYTSQAEAEHYAASGGRAR